MNAFNARGIAFALKCTTAAIAAILVALWFNLPSPGWAGLTVFLVSQPLGAASGAVVSRAAYRTLGTLVAAAGILFVIPTFVGEPELLIFGVALWVGICLYLALIDRSARSYTFLLASYTLPLIGMTQANNPGGTFNVAVWRAEEIMIGGAFAVIVHSLFAPHSVKPMLIAKAQAAVNDAKSWIVKGIGPDPVGEAERKARERVAADLNELRNLAGNLRFEPAINARDSSTAIALEDRFVALLPLLAGVEDRLAALAAGGSLVPQATRSHLDSVAAFIAQPSTRAEALELGKAGMALVNVDADELSADELMLVGAMQRMAELLEVWSDIQALMGRLQDGTTAPDEWERRLVAEASTRVLHVDHGIAALSALTASIAVSIAAGMCWVVGWDQGTFAIGVAAAGSALFAFLDDPRPILRILLTWTMVAAPTAALYLFAIFPALSSSLELAIVLAPLFFFTALYLATPNLWMPALSFALVSQSLMALQPVQVGDFVGFVGSAIGSTLGTIIALVVVSLIRVIGFETSVTRLLRASWRDLVAMAEDETPGKRAVWVSRMLDRMGMLLPRMAKTTGVLRARASRALDDLRLGANIVELKEVAASAKPEVRAAIELALKSVASYFRQRLRRPEAEPHTSAVESIDLAIARLQEFERSSLRVQGLTAATGLRLGLSTSKITGNATGGTQ